MPFRDSRTQNIELKDYGDFLSVSEGAFKVRHKNGEVETYPFVEKQVGSITLRNGASASVNSLNTCALWGVDVFFGSRHNRMIAVLKSLEDDSHISTRLGQYEALFNGKAQKIAVELIKAKIEGQNMVLKKWNLEPFETEINFDINDSDNLSSVRKKLTTIESLNARFYFKQIFSLFPENIRPEKRVGFKSFNGVDNLFNFSYYFLRIRVHKAILRAKMEPFLGFLHSNTQTAKPALVNDLQEIYRHVTDDFLIQRRQKFHKKDFVLVTDCMMRLRMGKRIHLCEYETHDLAEGLNELFERKVEIPRMRHGSKQTLDTLINEEAFLLAQYLRNEKESWVPRIASLT